MGDKPHLFNMYYVHEYLPKTAHRAVWIDTDMILKDDVAILSRVQMKHAVAAVPHGGVFGIKMWHLHQAFLKHMPKEIHHLYPSIDPNAPVYNFGMLVYNLKDWRSGEITHALESWTKRFFGFMSNHLPLNLEFHFRGIDPIDWRWNVLTSEWSTRLPQRCL